MRILSVVGTRPEAVKMAMVARTLLGGRRHRPQPVRDRPASRDARPGAPPVRAEAGL